MKFISADEPSLNGLASHLKCRREDVADIVLLPGDPGRVKMFKTLLDDFEIVSSNREYVVGVGKYNGNKITICSTGIGGPSTEIAVQQLIEFGAKVLIRIGGTGVIQEEIECGEMIINSAAMRLGGVSSFYVKPEYPAIASFEVVSALKEVCESKNIKHHIGIGASVSSFYIGQGRSINNCIEKSEAKKIIDEYRKLNIINLEMEAETIFTLASLNRVLAGSICSVHCNRITNMWLVDNEEAQINMCKVALEATTLIYKKHIK